MNITRLGIGFLCMALVGCSTSGLPHGARLVGGGRTIDYKAPGDGTAIITASGTMFGTKSLSEGEDFHFEVDDSGGPVPTNMVFRLYFVPAEPKQE